MIKLFLLLEIILDFNKAISLPLADVCVLSHSVYNSNEPGYYGYPSEYYAHFDVNNSRKQLKSSSMSSPCHAFVFSTNEIVSNKNDPEFFLNLTCSSDICPLNQMHLGSFRSESINTYNNAQFCSLYKTLTSSSGDGKKEINFIILGGSVTEGYRTEGCRNTNISSIFDSIDEISSTCSYGAQLYRWIYGEASKISNVTVKFKRATLGGWTSQVMSELVLKELSNRGITSLTPNDIVIIDHSANDDAKLSGNAAFMTVLEHSVELIIRKLLSISEASGPVIILHNMATRLRYEGYQREEKNETIIKMALKPHTESDIGSVYIKIANHYRIPFWSYQNLLWGKNVDEFGLFQRVGAYGNIHPPWHIHLLVSDLFASSIKKEFSKCISESTSLYLNNTIAYSKTEFLIPPKLFNSSIAPKMFCDVSYSSKGTYKNDKIYLDRDSTKVYEHFRNHTNKEKLHNLIFPVHDVHKQHQHKQHNLHSYRYLVDLNLYNDRNSSINFVSKNSFQNIWILRKERRDKIGWISELSSAQSETKENIYKIHRNISSNNDIIKYNLTFHIKVSHKTESDEHHIWDNEVGIQIYVMKTYLNAGVGSVFVCNYKVGTIDALWKDYETYRVTTPELQSFMLPWFPDTSQHPCHPSQNKPHTISIVHEKVDDNIGARTASQKLKIISITVCKPNKNIALGYDR